MNKPIITLSNINLNKVYYIRLKLQEQKSVFTVFKATVNEKNSLI